VQEFIIDVLLIVIVIVSTGASCLSELLKTNNSIQNLTLRDNYIGDDGMTLVAEGLKDNKTLTLLNIFDCGISVEGTIVYQIRSNHEK